MVLRPGNVLGGGLVREINVYGQQAPVEARVRLFRTTDIGVVIGHGPLAGRIVVPRWEEYVEGDLRWSTSYRFQPYTGLYEAGRHTLHILNDYGLSVEEGERRKLLDAWRVAEQINLAAVTANGGDIAELRRQLADLVSPFTQSFGNPRVRAKREALEYILRAKDLADTLGRDNPTVAMSQAVASIHRTRDLRLEALIAISSVVANRRQALRDLRELAVLFIRMACDLLDRVLALEPSAIDARVAKSLAQECRLKAQTVSRIDFEPLRSNCRDGAAELRRMADLFDSGDTKGALELAQTPRMSFRIKKVQSDLECVIRDVTLAVLNPVRCPLKTEWAVTRLIRLAKRLEAIDEAGFRRQVCRESTARIGLAIESLAAGPNDLASVKAALKAASQNL